MCAVHPTAQPLELVIDLGVHPVQYPCHNGQEPPPPNLPKGGYSTPNKVRPLAKSEVHRLGANFETIRRVPVSELVQPGTKPEVPRLEFSRQGARCEAVLQGMQMIDPPPSRSLRKRAAIPDTEVTETRRLNVGNACADRGDLVIPGIRQKLVSCAPHAGVTIV